MAEIVIDEIERKNKKKGFYTSLILHILVLILALLPLLTFPVPPPGQEGILVNLGMPDVGQGEENAPPSKSKPTPVQPDPTPPPPPEPEPEPEPEPAPPEPEPIPEPEAPPKEVKTDDNSKEIALKKELERKKREEEARERREREREIRQQREREEAERKKREEAERKRQQALEEARRKAAEEEAKRKAEEERRRREAAAKAEIDDLMGGLGGGSGDGKGNTGTSGNQGDPNGDPNSDILEGISDGVGSSVGGGLGGRGIMNAPKITDDFSRPGKVVLKVCVDRSGKVISADFTQRGSTTTDSQLVSIARKNARRYKFSSGSIDKQCGTITYVFKVR